LGFSRFFWKLEKNKKIILNNPVNPVCTKNKMIYLILSELKFLKTAVTKSKMDAT